MLEIAILLCLCAFIFYMVRILIIALDRGLVWFFCSLFIPFFIYIYCFKFWDEVEKPFMRGHIALILAIGLGGVFMYNLDPTTAPVGVPVNVKRP